MELIYLPIIIAASALWMLLLVRLDRFRLDKGHTRIVFAGFLMGCLSVIPTLWFYSWHPLGNFFKEGNPLEHMLVVGPVEESAKFLLFVILVSARRSIKEPQDGMIQGAAVGLGFSAVENFYYAVDYGLETLLLRSVLTMVGHMVWAAFWGFSYGAATYAVLDKKNKTSFVFVAVAFFPAAMAHGLYNSSLETSAGLSLGIAFCIIMLAVALMGFKLLLGASPYYPFPYSEAARAINAIRQGLACNPGSRVLRRRLGLYCLAGGRFRDAERVFRACAERASHDLPYRLLEGVSLMGSGQSARGTKLIGESFVSLGGRQKAAVKNELKRVIRSRFLYGRILDAMNGRREKNRIKPVSISPALP